MNNKIIPRSCQVEKLKILGNVLKIKRQQYLEKYGYEPNPLELDNFEDWEARLEVRPWCNRENHVLFRDVLTNEVRPFNCNQIRCGCQECTKGYVYARRNKMKKVIVKYNLNRFWTLTLDPKTIEGKTQDEKRVIAWAVMSDKIGRLKRAIKHFLVKNGWAKKENIVIVHWIEPHKNLMPHVHILTNQYVPMEKLLQFAKKIGFGHCFQKNVSGRSNKSLEAMSEYSSKIVIDPNTTEAKRLAEYAAKEAKDCGHDVDEKFFDKRALHYLAKRMRLIGFTRNVKVEDGDSGASPWILMINAREIVRTKIEIELEELLKVPEYMPLNDEQYGGQIRMIVDILEDKLKVKLNEKFKQDLFFLRTTGTLEEVKGLLKKEIQKYCLPLVKKIPQIKVKPAVQKALEVYKDDLQRQELRYKNLDVC